ncbi:MAG: helix-turn-helix domain-containing protein [Bacteroidales bacterium]|nr:helix-turn-helix domain-containing protein [Bacteroidales bacterium]
MIQLNFLDICKQRAIQKPYTFLKKIGFTHNVAHYIASNRAKSLSFTQIEILCKELYCTPNDLFNFSPVEGFDKNHPLNSITKPEVKINFNQQVKTIPLQNIDKLNATLSNLQTQSPNP